MDSIKKLFLGGLILWGLGMIIFVIIPSLYSKTYREEGKMSISYLDGKCFGKFENNKRNESFEGKIESEIENDKITVRCESNPSDIWSPYITLTFVPLEGSDVENNYKLNLSVLETKISGNAYVTILNFPQEKSRERSGWYWVPNAGSFSVLSWPKTGDGPIYLAPNEIKLIKANLSISVNSEYRFFR